MTTEIVVPDWMPVPGVTAATTLRYPGNSQGEFAGFNLAMHVGDSADHVLANRRRLVRDCDLPGEPAWLMQTHSTVVAADNAPATGCDAIVTGIRRRVLVVLTADCLPVVLAAADGTEIGVAHAGWRGLCNEILEATVNTMQTPPHALQAWLGPAISQSAFEVGVDVRDAFLAKSPAAADCFLANARGRFQADLYALARQRLAVAGVATVSGGEFCTHADSQRFFSYRRDGQCGRMATFVYLA